MDRQQATVAEWVALWPIFDDFTRETRSKGGVRLWVPWWKLEAAENKLRVTVEYILEGARLQPQQ